MLFKGERPATVLHRKVNGERRCFCGATLTLLDGEWIHPEVKEVKDENNKEVWVIKIAMKSDECPFKDNESSKCHHTGNKSGICNKRDCKVKAVFLEKIKTR